MVYHAQNMLTESRITKITHFYIYIVCITNWSNASVLALQN